MPKISTNITIDTDVKNEIDVLREKPTENRTFSNMVETLIKEALEARKKTTINKAKKN